MDDRPAATSWKTPPMGQSICALCGKWIKPTDNKVTVQGVAQHMACWDRAEARRPGSR
jgi:hypothetical protein